MLVRRAKMNPLQMIILLQCGLLFLLSLYELVTGINGLRRKIPHMRGFVERGLVMAFISIFAVMLPYWR